MGPAAELDDAAVAEQGLVAGVIIDHEVPVPALEEQGGVLACAAGLVVEHDDGRALAESVC
jgi:hypothetical protein